jgi:hypothetical protein
MRARYELGGKATGTAFPRSKEKGSNFFQSGDT